MEVVAVVPSFREEGLVGRTVSAILAIGMVSRVVVVDDCSGDNTPREAEAAGAAVVINGTNLGKGGSLNRVVKSLRFDVLLLMDGDLGDHALWARELLEPVIQSEADLSIAAFPAPALKGGFGVAKGLGGLGIRMMAGRDMASPLSGQRAMTREVFDAVAPFDPGFGMEVGMTIDALRSGFTVIEVMTEMSHRETGRDLAGFRHRGMQFKDILLALLRRIQGRGR